MVLALQVPGLSSFFHDVMPYQFCCKWATHRCQMFYWRRPSSSCQEYNSSAVGACLAELKCATSKLLRILRYMYFKLGHSISGSIFGAGHVTTIENQRFTFNEPGVYTLLRMSAGSDHVHEPYVSKAFRFNPKSESVE